MITILGYTKKYFLSFKVEGIKLNDGMFLVKQKYNIHKLFNVIKYNLPL